MRLCCVILDKTFNQSTYHASKNSQHRTGDKLWGASCEVKPSVSWKWRCGCECDLSEQESIATAILWFSVNIIMFCIEAYVSITWCGELEQAVLFTELLFKCTKAGHAWQEKCSQTMKKCTWKQKAGSAIETLKEWSFIRTFTLCY